MESLTAKTVRVGDWHVHPSIGQISRDGTNVRVEERTIRLLLYLASRPGEVVSIEELLDKVWPDVVVAPDSVYQAITSLRRLLGDDAKQPKYVATVPRLGYRLVAEVSSIDGPTPEHSADLKVIAPGRPRLTPRTKIFIGALCCLALLALGVLFRSLVTVKSPPTTAPEPPPRSIAVLPFLDLTEGMTEETFADGITEEVINKLSKLPSLTVASPTASFYFKDKKVPVAEVAKTLRVVYVIDGSVRKSGSMVRVSARLVRASDGYVLWAETYDRPFRDIVSVQDDIATRVSDALRASIPPNSAKPT